MHPDAGSVIRGTGELGFRTVVLTTNGERLPEFLPDIVGNVTDLVVSVDTLDAIKADAWYGKGQGTLDRVLENVEHANRARAAAKRPFTLTLATVVTPNNMDDVYDVYDYAQQRGYRFSASPELQGVTPPKQLRASDSYRACFDFLLAEKARGGDIFGSVQYLEHLRDFRPFVCHPLTMLAVSPDGGVFYPCLEKANTIGSILTDDLHELRREASRTCKRQTQPCPCACPSPCALGLSLLVERPIREVSEAISGGFRALRTGRVRSNRL